MDIPIIVPPIAPVKKCAFDFFPGFANRPANSLTLAIELPGRMVVFVFEKIYRNRTGIDKIKQD